MRKRALSAGLSLLLLLFMCAGSGYGQILGGNGKSFAANGAKGAELVVDARVALASLTTIGDGHLVKIADEFKLLATRDEVISADWDRIKALLTQVAEQNVPGMMWFAQPSGDYKTVEHDGVEGNLKSRPYFTRALAGKTVIGDLVVSKSTGKNVAVVAVPVLKDKDVVGVLGCSVYLDKLSEQVKEEMALPSNVIFYSFDSRPLMALDWDTRLILRDPGELGPEVDKAFKEMLKKDQGTVSYTFRGKPRTVVFKKSPVTDWWYAVGVVQGE
ncbi:cache domain-containing protein [Geotalea sp. SG265]|uniref:cache domain-containing protein n=1 Tax=Geotalea sp. SG265 TaxID=2922867 RepID=UPI001FAF13DA|nr:cache domain-containing protein [Geotalea sp. SG265]